VRSLISWASNQADPHQQGVSGKPIPLPRMAAGLALEGPRQLGRDPSAIKTTRLRTHRGTADCAVEIVGVKRNAVSQRLGARQGLWIAPSDLCQATRAIDQIPIVCRAFPFTERAAASRTQQGKLNIGQRQIESRRVRSLPDCPGSARSGHFESAPTDYDLARFTNQLRRAREIPHGDLSLRRNGGKRWAVLAAPAPLCACSGDGIDILVGHRCILKSQARLRCRKGRNPAGLTLPAIRPK
jgi:hypothetical protein